MGLPTTVGLGATDEGVLVGRTGGWVAEGGGKNFEFETTGREELFVKVAVFLATLADDRLRALDEATAEPVFGIATWVVEWALAEAEARFAEPSDVIRSRKCQATTPPMSTKVAQNAVANNSFGLCRVVWLFKVAAGTGAAGCAGGIACSPLRRVLRSRFWAGTVSRSAAAAASALRPSETATGS